MEKDFRGKMHHNVRYRAEREMGECKGKDRANGVQKIKMKID